MAARTVATLMSRCTLVQCGRYITLSLLLCLWQASILIFHIPRFLLPSVPEVARAFINDAPLLLQGLETTLLEIVLSLSFSFALGILLAAMVLGSSLFNRAVFPLIVVGQSVPVLAAAPLFIVWFGYGLPPKIVIATLITFFPILMGTVLGIRSIDEATVAMTRSIGLNAWQRFMKIELPGALPSLFGGLRIAVTLVLVGVVVGEFVGSSSGLGYIILRATGVMNTALLFAALISLIVIGLCMFGVLALVERAAMPWKFDTISA